MGCNSWALRTLHQHDCRIAEIVLAIDRRLELVRKAGLEPAWLAPPPPQDGVSANSTTSAFKAGSTITTSRGCGKLDTRYSQPANKADWSNYGFG